MRRGGFWSGSAAISALAVAFAAAVASAEPPPPSQPSPAASPSAAPKGPPPAVEIVVTGTRTPESSQRATVRTDFVSREEAERRGATNVAEALQGEPTLQVNPEAYGYLGRPSGVQMQGLDAERVLVLEDGERVLGDEGGVADLSQQSLVDVERIEYVAGPTSSLYGTNALGGVINIVSAPPRALGPSLRYRAEARNTGEALGSASGAYRHDDSWLSLDASLHHRPGVRIDDSQPELSVPVWRSSVLGVRAGFRVSRQIEVRLKARWLHDRSDGVESQDVPGLGTYLSDLPDVTNRFGLRAQETIQLGSGKHLDISLSRSWFRDQAWRDRRNSPVDELRQQRLENQGLEAVLTVPDGSRTWVLGVRTDDERFSQSLERTLPDLTRVRTREIDPMLLSSGALYGQLGWKIGDVWTLMPGVRAELHDHYGGVVAPRLATAFQFNEWLSARAALGRGFRAPTAEEFGFQFDHSALGYRVTGNPNLDPETSWGATGDVSVRRPNVRLRVGGFYNAVKNLIAADLQPEQPVPGVTAFTYRNVESARTAGGDVSVKAKLVDRLSLDAAYAYLWTRDLTSGEPLPARPAHTVTLAANAELQKLNATVRYRVVSDAFVLQADDGDQRSPAFGLLDARLAYRVFSTLEVYAGALNLLGVRRNPLDPTDDRPALGRQFYLGISGGLPAGD
jgi:outer membrane receptor for ferrienterochelin and colicins